MQVSKRWTNKEQYKMFEMRRNKLNKNKFYNDIAKVTCQNLVTAMSYQKSKRRVLSSNNQSNWLSWKRNRHSPPLDADPPR